MLLCFRGMETEGNWDNNSRWNFTSEAGNGLSWLLVGAVSLLT